VFTHRFALTLTHEIGVWRCRLEFAPGVDVVETVREFRIEVLDYVLRERIRNETAPVRNTILAMAFSRVDLDEESRPR
jgi:His-Xaa-Ser system protein HxsD